MKIWQVYFGNDGDGWSTFHATQQSAQLCYSEQMISDILNVDEDAVEVDLRGLSEDALHEHYEEATGHGGWYEEVDLHTFTTAEGAKAGVT
ncbi:hypothetical protein [Methylobacterium sp. CM6247]